jgi:hypothetical protein
MSLVKKIKKSRMFDCNNISGFLSANIINLDQKKNGIPQLFICELADEVFIVKLCFYKLSVPELYVNTRNVIHQNEAEIKILTLLLKLLDDKYLDTILRLYHVHTCDDISNMIPNERECMAQLRNHTTSFKSIMCMYGDQVKAGLALPRCSFLVLELCDITLSSFLEKFIFTPINLEILKSILFQIIHTLYIITQFYPQFHHYDLHTDNVMLKIDKNRDINVQSTKYHEYYVGDKKYYIPYFGLTVKIIDFEFAAIPEQNIISVATLDRLIMYQRPDNDFVFTLFWVYHTLYSIGSINNILEEMFVNIEPNETWKYYNIQYIRKIEKSIPSYEKMLKSASFKHFTKKPCSEHIITKFTKL